MSTKIRSHPTPVLRDTLYDRVSSWTIALFVGMAGVCVCVVAVWVTNRLPPPPKTVPVELVEVPGGFDDGSPDETQRVDSPEPEVHDASPTDMPADKLEISEALDTVVELSESATQQVQQQFDTGIQNSGKPGSARGTGRKGLGVGPGVGGMPREQRWFVRFGDRAGVDEYAKQLEFFGIELGALLPNGKLAYLSKLTEETPGVRYADGGKGEQRLYMTWQGGIAAGLTSNSSSGPKSMSMATPQFFISIPRPRNLNWPGWNWITAKGRCLKFAGRILPSSQRGKVISSP